MRRTWAALAAAAFIFGGIAATSATVAEAAQHGGPGQGKQWVKPGGGGKAMRAGARGGQRAYRGQRAGAHRVGVRNRAAAGNRAVVRRNANVRRNAAVRNAPVRRASNVHRGRQYVHARWNRPGPGRRWYRGGYWGGNYWGPGYYDYGWGGWGAGGWAAAAIVGTAAGVAIGAAATSPYYVEPNVVYYEGSSGRIETRYETAPVVDGDVPPAGGYAPFTQGWVNYCSSKYRSFDPSVGTYVGYDGYRHYCQ